MVYFQDLRYCLFFYEVVLGGGVGWGAVLLRCRNQKNLLSQRGGGGHVRQLENLVCKVGLPQIVLELL